jgi:hypothetical protein
MKKKLFSAVQVVTVFTVGVCVVASLAFIKPMLTMDDAGRAPSGNATAAAKTTAANMTEEARLVAALEKDGLISEADGFVVELKDSRMLVNNQPLAADVAGKYLQSVKKSELRIEVHSFRVRLLEHPDAQFIQVALPVLMSSPCVVAKLNKPGC